MTRLGFLWVLAAIKVEDVTDEPSKTKTRTGKTLEDHDAVSLLLARSQAEDHLV
ncbi:MAG: hypothetical protein LAP61_05805 [Acidobacteriia bacterium]|nr:hypothetical protein [Terriglobia bacterium]